MAWTYDQTDLNGSTDSGRLNAVRLIVGDTDSSDPQVQDEEIQFSLELNSNNIYSSASWIARTLASKYSRLVDTDLDGQLAESYSQLYDHYTSLAKQLDFQGKKYGGSLGVTSGGIPDGKSYKIWVDQFRYESLDYDIEQ